MITSIELGNFLSHSDTKLDFEDGVTVFVGHNGAGKSSIIDAITFSLFGQHTRKSNKSLIKRGTNQAYARINFSVNGRMFQAERKIDSKGTLSAQFSEKQNGEFAPIAVGERKQFGESMTEEIEKRIGLDFEKLKIASIVQQGELNSIIKAKPKEFKELLNAIIGIDKLDVASEAMKLIYKEFREKIRNDVGFDDTHIDILKRDLEKFQNELTVSLPQKIELVKKREQYERDVKELRKKVDIDSPKVEKLSQLETRKRELIVYAKEAIQDIHKEISENERKLNDCEGCFEIVSQKQDLEVRLERVEEAMEENQLKTQTLTSQKISLVEKQSLASKLQLKDDKCPVCDSKVEKLNPLFQEEHLKQEIKNIEEQLEKLENEKISFSKKRREFSENLQKVRDSEATLRAHAIKEKNDLKKIRHELEIKKTSVQKIPATVSTSVNLIEIATLDTHTKELFDSISKLEQETSGFDEEKFLELKNTLEDKHSELSRVDQMLGAVSEKISKNEEQIKKYKSSIEELEIVKKYIEELESIQKNIFNRDGPVATSLRSWALNTISSKASEYLSLLNTKIQRILLSEKTRDITVTCYSRNEVLEIESLSGGEQVSVALALRLGMASLLGTSNLNLMILDEPTTHLDAERRKALVGVLSQLSNITNTSNQMQFIIITHDAEIFEDSTVERIYKFESNENGSIVVAV